MAKRVPTDTPGGRLRYWRVTAAATHPLQQGIKEIVMPRVVSQSSPKELEREVRAHLKEKGFQVIKVVMTEFDPTRVQ